MPETLKSLLAKREILMNRADAVRKTDPKMADYLDGLGNDMDSELEGTDPIQERDANGFLQGEDPDYQAYNEAHARVRGAQGDDYPNPIATSPTYRGAVESHLGQILRENFQRQMQAQTPQYPTPQGAQLYNNSVTPSAQSLQQINFAELEKQRRDQQQANELRDMLSVE